MCRGRGGDCQGVIVVITTAGHECGRIILGYAVYFPLLYRARGAGEPAPALFRAVSFPYLGACLK